MTTEESNPTPRRKHRGLHLLLVVAVGIAAYTIAKPMLVGDAGLPTAGAPSAPQAATQNPSVEPLNVPPQVARLADPDNLPMAITQGNLWYQLNGTYAGAPVDPSTLVARADTTAYVLARLTAAGNCTVASAANRLARPVVVDPSGAACTDPAAAVAVAGV